MQFNFTCNPCLTFAESTHLLLWESFTSQLTSADNVNIPKQPNRTVKTGAQMHTVILPKTKRMHSLVL